MESLNNEKSIKHWANDDKPREKLILKGKNALSDAELIAILIGSGSRNESAVALSKKILKSFHNNINELSKASIDALMQFKGIGEAKAISIITALELGKRQRLEAALELPKITSSRNVFELLHPSIGDLPHEEFWIVFLNNSNKVIGRIPLSKGGLTATVVDVRLLFKRALELRATAIILGHNHPSGSLKPSTADKNITKKIKEAGEVLDVKLLDHLIVTQKSYYSFADEGML